MKTKLFVIIMLLGLTIAATVLGDQVYLSKDGGNSWIARDSNRSWSDVATSSDGSKIDEVTDVDLVALP